jgi:hypothetical protein
MTQQILQYQECLIERVDLYEAVRYSINLIKMFNNLGMYKFGADINGDIILSDEAQTKIESMANAKVELESALEEGFQFDVGNLEKEGSTWLITTSNDRGPDDAIVSVCGYFGSTVGAFETRKDFYPVASVYCNPSDDARNRFLKYVAGIQRVLRGDEVIVEPNLNPFDYDIPTIEEVKK